MAGDSHGYFQKKNMEKKKETILSRVKEYVNGSNLTLVHNQLKVSGNYKMVEGVRCVEVMLDGDFIYQYRIELLCDHTGTTLHAITLHNRRICMLLKDKGKESE